MPSLTTSPPTVTENLWLCHTEAEQISVRNLVDILEKAFPDKKIQVQPVVETATAQNGLVLVTTLHPILSLALRLDSGVSSEAALAEWIQCTDAMLKLQRRNRHKTIFADIELFTGDGAAQDRDFLIVRVSGDTRGSFPSSQEIKEQIPDPGPISSC